MQTAISNEEEMEHHGQGQNILGKFNFNHTDLGKKWRITGIFVKGIVRPDRHFKGNETKYLELDLGVV